MEKLPPIAELFDRYAPLVYRRCLKLLRAEDQAEDAVQEVFLRAASGRERFRGGASPGTWLYAIATTHCLQQLRNQERRARRLAELLPPADAAAESTSDERLAWERVLAELEPDVQQIALHRHLDRMTLEEIALALGISRKTVARKLDAFAGHARSRLGMREEDGHAG